MFWQDHESAVNESSKSSSKVYVLSLCMGSFLFLLMIAHPVWAGQGGSPQGHTDPFASIILALTGILIAAALGRGLAMKLNQPAVLGELVIGVVIGNVGYWLAEPVFVLIMYQTDMGALVKQAWTTGASLPETFSRVFDTEGLVSNSPIARLGDALSGPQAFMLVNIGAAFWMFSNLGVLLLLFLVGLESSPEEMARVGGQSAAVAVVGVVLPFTLGFLVALLFLPEASTVQHAFVGATLCATSVGITARLFTDMKRVDMPEAKVILGAAVIDDILGLVVLAVVIGLVQTGRIILSDLAITFFNAAAFLAVVLFFGQRCVRAAVPVFRFLDESNIKLIYPLCLCFFLAWAANIAGLAAIVGAFAAGLILSDRMFGSETPGSSVTQAMRPLGAVFSPIFFVVMGMQVNLETFASVEALGLAVALTLVGVAGKFVAGYAVRSGIDRATIGLGMVPRGEVGLIFASVGKGLGVLDEATFSAVVMTVVLTTFIAPLALRYRLRRSAVS
ncbi:MAG: cation:proton antiporter [Methyloceanibacter sp.]|nr:cation:proton antiporter [Methyloceanibacter sp.]